ncbi:MAG: hypothetical protein ACLUE1_01630 [Adlercreutzia equolifaciens]
MIKARASAAHRLCARRLLAHRHEETLSTFVDETAQLFDTIHFSGGKVGCQIRMNPDDLARLVPFQRRPHHVKLQLMGRSRAVF